MTNDVFLSPQSVAKKLYPYLISVFHSVFLMIICFPLLFTLSPQLIINFFHDSQLSRSVRMEVLSVSDYSKPGSVFYWTIFHTTQQRWEYEAHSSWTSFGAEQSHDPSSCASCHLCGKMVWFAGWKCTECGFLTRHHTSPFLQLRLSMECFGGMVNNWFGNSK